MTDHTMALIGEPRSIERDGCTIGYRVSGRGDVTLILFSAWQIVHSGAWKGQVPYLAEHYRVIAVDCRGNGRSGRPVAIADYSPWALVADAAAVLDAEGIQTAIVAGFSYGAHLAALFASTHPARCQGAVLIAPSAPFGPDNPAFAPDTMLAQRATYTGWEKYNFPYWSSRYDDFVNFFMREVFPEPHSEKQIEDAIAWAGETDPETLTKTVMARFDSSGQGRTAYEAIRCPVLVIHGTEDQIVPHPKGELVAEITGGRLVSLPGSGHMPGARAPVKVNRAIRRFVDEVTGRMSAGTGMISDDAGTARSAPRARTGRVPRALYLSSPIGLGHVRRDRAIAEALRRERPDVRIDWLAQPPVTYFLEAAGERVHPASRRLLSESAHIEAEAGEHDLNAFQALRRMDAILVANFCHFQDIVDAGDYDLVIADEAWDIDRFWHEHPELKRSKLAWMTDFVGVLPMDPNDSTESRLANDWNAEMIGFIEGRPDVRDAALFMGDVEDLVDLPFGSGLPSIRDWTSAHHAFPGYPSPSDGLPPVDRNRLRRMLGLPGDAVVCLVAVGGSGIGRTMIERLVAIAPQLRAGMPALIFDVITGPRIDPLTLPVVDGVIYRRFVSEFLLHVQACDIAIVQGGLSTTMELTCLRKPFLYVPLERHFEQQIHVHHRLQRHGLGERIRYAELADAEHLARRIESLVRPSVRCADILTPTPGGAARAAAAIAALL